MKTSLKNNLGFTILELVVVIAIIGILGAIGIPAYQGYVTKAKETKAQNTLQSIYMMEKNFFSQNYCYYKTYLVGLPGDDTININEQLFGSTNSTAGPIEVGSTNDYYFYVSGTSFVCAGTSCICSTNNASDFTIFAVNKAAPSKIFSVNHQNIKTGF
jgi:prepilin-type N-terminal cleavage/methylation domain-containing protein